MSVFWLLVAAMTALALLFVVPPLLNRKSVSKLDHDQITTAVIKQQLTELTTDLEAGKLDKAAYTAARHDLERALLDDVNKPSESQPAVERSGRWASGMLALTVPAAALFLYHQLGSQTAVETNNQISEMTAGSSGLSLEAMIEKLAKRLKEDPDNAEGWVMLASSYASLNQFDKAADAYKEALQRSGDHPQLLTNYADTLAMASGGDFTDEVGELLKTALKLQPDNVKALWLMGHWHYQRKQHNESLSLWGKASALLPAGSDNADALNKQIQFVRNKLGMAEVKETTDTQTTPTATGKASIQVTVSLDPTFKDKTSPEDTLFIFARAAKGPRMPLAIVKKQVKDLPITVTLDDSQAMSPQMVLSKFPEVSVGARISKTGNAMPSTGDLKGEKSPVSVDQGQTVNITISEIIP
jgi:cytochrome c-type biogenesis protein CcmH